MDEFINLGDRLKQIRKEQGFTQEELGKLVNLTKQAISRIEKNKNKYTDTDLIKIIAFNLKCTPDYLLGLSDDKNTLQNNKKQVISFDPNAEIKNKLEGLFVRDREFAELVLECENKLNKKEIRTIKLIMQSLIADK